MPDKKKKRGRPKLSPDQRRTVKLEVRMNEAERDIIDAAATSAEQTTSEWARSRLVKAAQRATGQKRGAG